MNENTTMMYENIPAVSELNKVDGFDPRKYLREMINESGEKGLYLDVQWRKLWFRLKHPNGRIKKTIVKITEETVIIEARVYLDKNDPDESYISSAMAQRWRQLDDKIKNQYVETAETAATGRALLECGFGLQFCDIGGEKDTSVVDSPISAPSAGNTETDQNNTKVKEKPNNTPPAKPATNTVTETNTQTKTPPASPAANIPGKSPVNTSANVPPKTENTTPAQSGGKQYDSSTPVDEICGLMNLDDAKAYVIDVGVFRGKTLGQLAIDKPASLEWYVKSYNGPDNILRAGAKLLITEATKQAG